MIVKKLDEHGIQWAALGVSLSHDSNPQRAMEIMPNLAHKSGGHNKFLESISLWLDVTFPRGVWQEAATYRIGNSAQSQSTMHTLVKRPLAQSDFELPIWPATLERLNFLIWEYGEHKDFKTFLQLKGELPEGFLQRRIWAMNYMTFRNIYHQRVTHRLPYWRLFLEEVVSQLEHPEYIIKPLTPAKKDV